MDTHMFYKDESIIEFNELSPLINVPFSSGYRIITSKVSHSDMLDYLSDNYGEGNLIGNAIHNSKWILKQKSDYTTLFIILVNKEMVDNLIEHFNLVLIFDLSYELNSRIKKLLRPLVGTKNDRKTVRKIKQLIVKELNITTKDIEFNYKDNSVILTINNTKTSILL